MKQNKLSIIIGLIFVLAVAIEGYYILDLRQQINNEKTQTQDSVNLSVPFDDWFNGNDDNLFDLFTDFDNMQRDMDQLFGRFSLNFRGSPYFDSVFGNYTSSPAMDFIEEEDKYVIDVDLPGSENNSIEVNIENGILNISADIQQDQEHDDINFRHRERYSGKLKRSLTLPLDADSEKMTTQLDREVLKIIIPKRD